MQRPEVKRSMPPFKGKHRTFSQSGRAAGGEARERGPDRHVVGNGFIPRDTGEPSHGFKYQTDTLKRSFRLDLRERVGRVRMRESEWAVAGTRA